MTSLQHKLLTRLPKVDLHLHLDGSVKPETVLQLAQEQGIPLPDADMETIGRLMQVDDQCDSLRDYLSKFDFVLPFLQTTEALERTAYEVVEQASLHRCHYIEVRFAPQLHRSGGLTVDEVIRAVCSGLKRGEQTFGVMARAILICLRSHSYLMNAAVVEAAARFMDRGVVAVDLAGDEASYPAVQFRSLFTIAKRQGIPITIHAGEAAGAENIYEAVTGLGAKRIGHGVRLLEDVRTLELVRELRIPLEMCPVSNIQTKAVPCWDAYPIRKFMELGIPVTVNTDNTTVSGTTITKEYLLLADKFRLSTTEIAQIILNGVEAAFLDASEKRDLRNKVLRDFEQEGLLFS